MVKGIMKALNNLINKFKYRSHTNEVLRFIKSHYKKMEVDSLKGPFIDSEHKAGSKDIEDLYYFVVFKKDCPENTVNLKINKATKKVAEVERL